MNAIREPDYQISNDNNDNCAKNKKNNFLATEQYNGPERPLKGRLVFKPLQGFNQATGYAGGHD